MTSLNLWVPGTPEDTIAVRAELNRLGASLGYAATRGIDAGEGGMARLMVALARGELTVLPIAMGDRERIADVLAFAMAHQEMDGHLQALCHELAHALRVASVAAPVNGSNDGLG